MNCPGSLPNPVSEFIVSLDLPSPTPHPKSFFDPPSVDIKTRLSPVVARAKTFVHDLLPAWAENHVYRTYAGGLIAADIAGWSKSNPGKQYGAEALGWDKELWFLTAILHDIGWDAEENLKSRLSFEIFGGVKARDLLFLWGADQQTADEVCESIVRHTDGSVITGSVRLMCALAQLGALHDLNGMAVPSWMHPDDNRTICGRWPRVGIIEQLPKYIDQELYIKPGCLSFKWGGENLKDVMSAAVCFHGLEGEAQDDPEWAERRKKLGSY